MQQRKRQIWAGKRAIFRPLWWDLWTSDPWNGKRVIQASADRDLRRLRPFLWNILAFAARRFDFEPASLVFFSSGKPPPVLTRWKRFKTASNTVKQQSIRKESKASQFYSHNVTFFRYLKQTRKVPIQTLVNRMFVTQHRSKARVTFAYVSFIFNYFLSSRA